MALLTEKVGAVNVGKGRVVLVGAMAGFRFKTCQTAYARASALAGHSCV